MAEPSGFADLGPMERSDEFLKLRTQHIMLEAKVSEMSEKMVELASEVSDIKDDLKENTESTKKVEQNTGDIVAAFGAAKSAFVFFDWVGKLLAKVAFIGIFAGFVYGAWSFVKNALTFGPKL